MNAMPAPANQHSGPKRTVAPLLGLLHLVRISPGKLGAGALAAPPAHLGRLSRKLSTRLGWGGRGAARRPSRREDGASTASWCATRTGYVSLNRFDSSGLGRLVDRSSVSCENRARSSDEGLRVSVRPGTANPPGAKEELVTAQLAHQWVKCCPGALEIWQVSVYQDTTTYSLLAKLALTLGGLPARVPSRPSAVRLCATGADDKAVLETLPVLFHRVA
jgi:hypothetical protein